LEFRDFAILYRINALSMNLELAMKRFGIPLRVYGGMRFFDRAEVKDTVSYLAVIANPNDDLRLMRIINNPPRGLGAKTLETLQAIAVAEQTSVFDILNRAGQYAELKSAAARLGRFAEMITDWREKSLSDDAKLDELYDDVLDKSGYIHMLDEKASPETEARKQNVLELKTTILDFIARNPGSATLAAYLDEIALYATDSDTADKSNGVQLMTIHSSKGLEFPVVFLVGAEDGIFPGHRALGEPEELEEERRLCYVALTRAKEKLFIVNARQRMLYGKTMNNPASRFLESLLSPPSPSAGNDDD
jgi:DNA helicase-2/ATP-dependent DNA helicase PcrA